MKEKITATPQSFSTSILTPIVVQETPNVKIIFDGLQVDNHQEIKKNIKGKLIIKKKSKKMQIYVRIKLKQNSLTRFLLNPQTQVHQ